MCQSFAKWKGNSAVNNAAAQGAVANLSGVSSVNKLTVTAQISLALLTSSSWVAITITGCGLTVQSSAFMGSALVRTCETSSLLVGDLVSAFRDDNYLQLDPARGKR